MSREKIEAYAALVKKRKADHTNYSLGFTNPSQTKYDTEHIGNYSTWAHDLDADIVVVAQDFANLDIFNRDEGMIQANPLPNPEKWDDWDTPTNYFLWKLLLSVGRNIGTPIAPKKAGVFLTNAVMGLKSGKMTDGIPKKVYAHDGEDYLKPLIAIIKPKVVIALGTGASQSLLSLYSDVHRDNSEFSKKPMSKIFQHGPFQIVTGQTTLYPVYHPGRLGQANRGKIESVKGKNGWELMLGDWEELRS